jgi:hypothetical protein
LTIDQATDYTAATQIQQRTKRERAGQPNPGCEQKDSQRGGHGQAEQQKNSRQPAKNEQVLDSLLFFLEFDRSQFQACFI